MPKSIIDVFRFGEEPSESFSYLGAVWTIECRPAVNGDNWECTTTAPLSISLGAAESEAGLRHELLKIGVAAVRHSERWYLLQHLESLGRVERIGARTDGSILRGED